MEHLADVGVGASSCRWSSRARTSPQLDAVQGDRRPLRRAAAADAAAAVGPRRRRLGRPAPDAGAAARALRLAGRARRGRAHRRLVLPPRRRTGEALPGLNLCGAGRVVCLIDPVGDVYACPFAIHDQFLAGNVRATGGFARVWRESDAVPRAARAAERRARARSCEHVRRVPRRLHGGEVLHRPAARRARPGVRAGPRRARPGGRGARAGAPAVARPLAPRRRARRPGARADRSCAATGPATRTRCGVRG